MAVVDFDHGEVKLSFSGNEVALLDGLLRDGIEELTPYLAENRLGVGLGEVDRVSGDLRARLRSAAQDASERYVVSVPLEELRIAAGITREAVRLLDEEWEFHTRVGYARIDGLQFVVELWGDLAWAEARSRG